MTYQTVNPLSVQNRSVGPQTLLRIKNGESISAIARMFNTTRQTIMRVRATNVNSV
ncbi:MULTISPECIES: helix-turn-helix domain-containing protein [Vibrio]|uniref:helix-turn-helix domain-containing protein n=1 Tax=Vibrio TaxID=662 RepID=UPI0009A3414F